MAASLAFLLAGCAERYSQAPTAATSEDIVGDSQVTEFKVEAARPPSPPRKAVSAADKAPSALQSTLPPRLDGTWISTITSTHPSIPRTQLRRLVLNLKQDGNRIVATDSSGQTRIGGTLDGGAIDFRASNYLPYGFYGIRGRWIIGENGDLLQGSWTTSSYTAEGSWELRRYSRVPYATISEDILDAPSAAKFESKALRRPPAPKDAITAADKDPPALQSTLSPRLDGTWISTITSSHPSVPRMQLRRLVLKLKQDGNRIVATDGSGQTRIGGTLDGGAIDFWTSNYLPYGFYGIRGRWIVGENGNLLQGSWTTPSYPAEGGWTLRRFEPKGIELYTIETGPERPVYIEDSDRLFDSIFRAPHDRNVVFYIHGRGDDFQRNFEATGLPYIERQTNTRFVIMRWLSWSRDSVRPVDHASSAAVGLSEFLRSFDDYRSSHADKLGNIGVSLMAHSMGNIPLMVFLQEMYEERSLQPGLLDSVILTSSDVPLRNHAYWVEKIDFSDQVYIIQNRKDFVLRLSDWFFNNRLDWRGAKLGIGSGGEESAPVELADNALYLDVTDLTIPLSHRHFDMSSYPRDSKINRLYRLLLNGRRVRFPDADIGLFEESGSARRYVLRIE